MSFFALPFNFLQFGLPPFKLSNPDILDGVHIVSVTGNYIFSLHWASLLPKKKVFLVNDHLFLFIHLYIWKDLKSIYTFILLVPVLLPLTLFRCESIDLLYNPSADCRKEETCFIYKENYC